tara:strand:+ start:10718 stop:11779 length:1062 start_codon:yes stop_codon:yes gene_type:complete
MKFLNKKEQVLDTLLTSYGEYLLSTGRFKPEYYAFFDDNILYESQYGRPSESPEREQNSIEPRIQEETPQLETQVIFSSRDVFHNKGLGVPPVIALDIEQTSEELTNLKDSYVFERDFYGPQYALGTSDKLATNAPAWSASMIRGEITSASSSSSGPHRPTLDIPQLDVTLTYKIDVISDVNFVSDTELAVSFDNGEILDIEPEILIAQIKEINSEFSIDNFEIEVFETTTESVAGAATATVEVLRPLKFRKTPSLVQDGILLDEGEIFISNEPITPDHVQYYFDVKVDGQIGAQLICSSIEENKKSGKYINVDFECEDIKNIAFVDIYSTDAASEPCPDLDDPCEDTPGTVY